MNVPESVWRLVERSRTHQQGAIEWPADRWRKSLPAQPVFTRLPKRLGREHVRHVCEGAQGSKAGAMDAFLAAMAWGYGNVGYGPWRVTQALADPDAGEKICQVAVALNERGPLAAYGLMATECRLKRIGPAFGTKFLYFADDGRHARRALILDRLVAGWLKENTPPTVNPVPWSLSTYEAYLERMHSWAEALSIAPDALELAMFSEMADETGGQWAGSQSGVSSRTPE